MVMKYKVIAPKAVSFRDPLISLTEVKRSDRVNWCVENIGREEVDWRLGETLPRAKEFLFLREKDAVLFALKWL
jgi:hypothetical protein